jgi:hypothetical protein
MASGLAMAQRIPGVLASALPGTAGASDKGKQAGNAGVAVTAFMDAEKLKRSKNDNANFTLGSGTPGAAGTAGAKAKVEMQYPALTSFSMEPAADLRDGSAAEGSTKADEGLAGAFAGTLHAPGAGGDALVNGAKDAAPARPVDPTQALAKLHEIAQAVSGNGPKSIDLEVKLDDGGPVQVRVELQNGEVRMTLKSASPELQKALEQSWPAFRRESSASGLAMGEIRFEKSSSSSDSTFQNPAGQQQREGQQASRSADETGYGPNRRRPSTSTNTTTSSSTPNKPAPPTRPGTSLWA